LKTSHCGLDVAFRETPAENGLETRLRTFSRITRIALNLLKHNKTSKLGMKGKRSKPAGTINYLLQLLGVVL